MEVEFEKFPQSEAVKNRTEKRAVEVGKLESARLLEILRPFSPLVLNQGAIFTTLQIDAAVELKAEQEAAHFRKERAAGQCNDFRSEGAGLTALVFQGVKLQFEERLKFKFPERNIRVPFEEVGETTDSDEPRQLYRLSLPKGAYIYNSDLPVSISFFPEVRAVLVTKIVPEEAWAPPHFPHIPVSAYDVVTIHGQQGEFWQNPAYHPDGTDRSP